MFRTMLIAAGKPIFSNLIGLSSFKIAPLVNTEYLIYDGSN